MVRDNGLAENFFRRDGRLNRLRYFKRNVVVFLAAIVILFVVIVMDVNALGHLSSFGNGAIKIFSAVILIPTFCLMVRRLHDMDKSETLAYIYAVLSLVVVLFRDNDFLVTEPSTLENLLNIVSSFIGLYIFFCPGTKGDNQYGPDPLA